MRQHRTLDLDPGRRVTVHELRLRDVHHLLGLFTADALARPLPELLLAHWPEVMAMLDGALELPDGETLDDLSLSDAQRVGQGWWELHKDFFLGVLGGDLLAQAAALQGLASAAPSNAPP
jgi:hypothetical protein